MTTVRFEAASNGWLRIAERHCRGGSYDKTELLSDNGTYGMATDVELQIELNDDESISEVRSGVTIELSRHHVKAEISDRVFHIGAMIELPFQDVKRLHAFLGCLLSIGPLGATQARDAG